MDIITSVANFNNKFSGLDHWRLFECSFLNSNNMPVAVILDISYKSSKTAIDSMALKKLVNNTNEQIYSDIDAYIEEITGHLSELGLEAVNVAICDNYIDIKPRIYISPACSNDNNYIINFMFNCELTKAPFWATLHHNVALDADTKALLYKYLYNGTFKVQELANYIINFITQNYNEVAIELEVTRRGGIGNSYLRTTGKNLEWLK